MLAAAQPLARGFQFARGALRRGSAPRSFHLALLGGLLTPLSLAAVPTAAVLERGHFSLSAYLGLVVTLVAWNQGSGRVRVVRGWIAAGFVVWTALHLLKNIEYSFALPFAPDLLLLGVAAAAGGAYRADLVGRMPWREQLAVYLDAGVVTATVGATLLVLFADSALTDPLLASALLYAFVFLAILAGTLILDLAVLAELRLNGAYAILAGLGLLATGFTLRAGTSVDGIEHAVEGLIISAGGLVVAYGTATWNDLVDDNPRYVAVASRMRELLPLAAAVFTPLLLLVYTPSADPLVRLSVYGLAAAALIAVVVRQSLLLRERDGMLGRLAAARGAAERRTQQISGLEAVGRLLAAAGPTSEALAEVVEVIQERFSYAHVAVYLSDGPLLRLGAQRGYQDLYATLDGSRGITGRVMRTRRAELVRNVHTDPDYLMADATIGSEICAPLLEDGEFLGVLDVESDANDPLDQTDLAAVVAVADQLAAAIALAMRRQRLLAERNFTAGVLDTVAAVIVVTDQHGRVVRFNPMCAEVSGYSMAELAAHESFAFLVPADKREAVEAVVSEVGHMGIQRNMENDWIRKDGTCRRISWSNRPVLDEHGHVEYVIGTGIDITERKQLEEQLAHRALHDPLTGLPNRALLLDRLEHALSRRQRGAIVGVLFIDLDEFKMVNDTLGHDAGDFVLVQLANRLAASLRAGDTAARVGGDEFAVVLEELPSADEAASLAERIRAALSASPVVVNGTTIPLQASIGLATSAHGERDAGALLRNADIAMYAAKTGGGQRSEVFRPQMYDSIIERRDLEQQLSGAVERDEFVLHFQAIEKLSDRSLAGAEALLRWAHRDRGLLLPGEFLRVAEATALIVPIGGQVLRKACLQMASWLREDGSAAPKWISVNVSPRQFQAGCLFEQVQQALESAGLEPRRLVIEITESLMMDGSDATATTLQRLQQLGVRFAIDDFGTGYSSLSYLRRFPVELLKIDRSFIAGVDVEAQQSAFVGALVAMGATLGLSVLAEGIESVTQFEALRRLGCELGQGYYLGMPVAAHELVRSPVGSMHHRRRTPAAASIAAGGERAAASA